MIYAIINHCITQSSEFRVEKKIQGNDSVTYINSWNANYSNGEKRSKSLAGIKHQSEITNYQVFDHNVENEEMGTVEMTKRRETRPNSALGRIRRALTTCTDGAITEEEEEDEEQSSGFVWEDGIFGGCNFKVGIFSFQDTTYEDLRPQ